LTGRTPQLTGRRRLTHVSWDDVGGWFAASVSELIEAGQPLEPGKIYESIGSGWPRWRRRRSDPKIYPLVKDSLAETKARSRPRFRSVIWCHLGRSFPWAKWIFIKSAFGQMGGELQFWKVAIRPGRPFVLWPMRGKFCWFCPATLCLLCHFSSVGAPALVRWQGPPQ